MPTVVCHGPDCIRRMNRDYPLKAIDETYSTVIFQCPVCLNVRAVSKDHCGGTIGAGRRDDLAAKKYLGIGWRAHE